MTGKDSSKSTMLVISMGFLVLYLVKAWHWAVIVSLSAGIIGILSPFLSRKIEWAWMKLGRLLGYIVPNILLGIVFYLILFPISLLARLSRKDPLMLSKDQGSYFVDVEKETDRKDFEKIW
jgi:hypothetical protein